MQAYHDYEKRIGKIRKEMDQRHLDAFVGTRTVSLSYAAGAFIPWRSAVI